MNLELIKKLTKLTSTELTRIDILKQKAQLNNANQRNQSVLCQSASYFLEDNKTIFMSIHNEAGNACPHYHDFFEINYVLKGHPVGDIDNNEIALQKGNLIIMNPNAVHYFKNYKDEQDIVLNIVLPVETFKRSVFLPLISDSRLSSFFIRYKTENKNQSSFIFLDKLDISAENLLDILIREYLEKKSYNQVIIESLITLLFSFIFRSYNSKSSTLDNRVNDILDYIYQNYQTCTIEIISQVFNYHPKYLSSLISKNTGLSYRELLVNIKLQNALHYLLYTDYTIEEIVGIIGYKEKASFYNSFKKHFNVSPGEYRNNQK